MINKNDFIKAILKSHLEILEHRNHHSKEVLKIFTIILALLVTITFISIIFLSKTIGTTATQVILGVFLFLCLGIIIVGNDLKKILLDSEKDLQALGDYKKEIDMLKIFSKLGAAIPDPDSVLKTLNLRLSITNIEFQNLINIFNKYLPPNLLEDDIKKFETSGMYFDEDFNLFGKREGYRITYF